MNILFKLNKVIIVKLSREIRVNLGQNIAYRLPLSNKRYYYHFFVYIIIIIIINISHFITILGEK